MSYYKKCGIYCIENTVNNRKYIVYTMNCFGDRFDNHMYMLKNGKHHSKLFQEDFNIYGESSFKYIIIEEIDKDTHDIEYFCKKEKYYIELYNSVSDGYNVSTGGKAGYSGVKRPPEISQMVGEINRKRLTGTHLSDNIKRKISEGNKGKVMSKESKEKISKGNKNKVRTLEQRIHQSKVAKRKLTDEQAREIKDLLNKQNSVSEISEITGVSKSVINDIKRGKTYKLV